MDPGGKRVRCRRGGPGRFGIGTYEARRRVVIRVAPGLDSGKTKGPEINHLCAVWIDQFEALAGSEGDVGACSGGDLDRCHFFWPRCVCLRVRLKSVVSIDYLGVLLYMRGLFVSYSLFLSFFTISPNGVLSQLMDKLVSYSEEAATGIEIEIG